MQRSALAILASYLNENIDNGKSAGISTKEVTRQIEAGTIELTVHDLGCVDVGVAQFARTQNVNREDARKAIAQSIRDSSAEAPAMEAIRGALVSFVETPGQTLIIKLTPRAKVPALQLIQLFKTDPVMALAQFRIEASTGL